jgi:hypothetical protein
MTAIKNEIKINKVIKYISPDKYTGKLIRVGGTGDGSYVVPFEILNKNTYLISGGIENNNKFEIYAASRGISGIQIDNSINEPPQVHTNLKFLNATLGKKDSRGNISLETLIKNSPKKKNLFIKIDIEGSEIEALKSLSARNLKKIDCLVMELHNLGSITENNDEIYNLLSRLHDANLRSVYIQANNACLTYLLAGVLVPDNLEITYVKKSKTTKPDINYIRRIKKLATRNKLDKSIINIDHILFNKLTTT